MKDIMEYCEPITDRFIYFLNWLYDEKNYNGRDVINVVAKPYKYSDLFNEFYKEVYNGWSIIRLAFYYKFSNNKPNENLYNYIDM